MEWNKRGYTVSDNTNRMDTDAIFEMLSTSYWAADRPKEVITNSMKRSICFGIFEGERQIGFARVITDNVVFSWVCDVIIHSDYRGKGLGKWLFDCIMEHPNNQVKTVGLYTKDAHQLYEKFGFINVETMQCKKTNPKSWEKISNSHIQQ
ncbi:Acetyltransferase (GNAT) domain-containing protein [Gracilibacillus orientalis]|uniref:Acetyltransferase (GNAT) domain-containing protein n=1 Tax=Gracilibacillus orientalis TaxID=334253 RepID=A0A1I4IR71_9BACI|nr:GNAT family N-acetyltransferase [Gracilibacillus orientalis]SFL56785.1 Acetyltransferase (GNAT) domain-containing protein [Gracilibacillus orientalis]